MALFGPFPGEAKVENFAGALIERHYNLWGSQVGSKNVENTWSIWCQVAGQVANFELCIRK